MRFYLSIATTNDRWEFCSEWPENTVDVTLTGKSSIVMCLNDFSAWFQRSKHPKTISFSSRKNYVSLESLTRCKLHNIVKSNTHNSKCGKVFAKTQFCELSERSAMTSFNRFLWILLIFDELCCHELNHSGIQKNPSDCFFASECHSLYFQFIQNRILIDYY